MGESEDGTLLNDARMARRMLDYSLAIERVFESFRRQLVLDVGEAPMRGRDGASDSTLATRRVESQPEDRELGRIEGERAVELETLAPRLLDCASPEELFA